MDLSSMKEYETVSMFVSTRKILRDKLRKKHGNRGLGLAWLRYQNKYQGANKGKPKTTVYEVKQN